MSSPLASRRQLRRLFVPKREKSSDNKSPMNRLHLPPALKQGARVALVAPARYASAELLKNAENLLISWGFSPVIPLQSHLRSGQFGGDDKSRAAAMNAAFRNPDIHAVWAMRGGYGCTRLLPLLDGDAMKTHPTWITGFSDITALHGWANRLGVASLHGPVASTIEVTNSADVEEMKEVWMSGKCGAQTKRVVGGNLSVLYALLGTPYMPPLEGRWLLLEEVDEYLYHIDRMLVALSQAGVFDVVAGVMVGSFTDLRDNTKAHGQAVDNPFGMTIQGMVEEHIMSRGCAVEWDVPVGHGQRNIPLVLG